MSENEPIVNSVELEESLQGIDNTRMTPEQIAEHPELVTDENKAEVMAHVEAPFRDDALAYVEQANKEASGDFYKNDLYEGLSPSDRLGYQQQAVKDTLGQARSSKADAIQASAEAAAIYDQQEALKESVAAAKKEIAS